MPGKQSTSPQANRDAALHILRTLRAQGHEAYFAGGCVRDELLGLVPSDYDVATDATPERIATIFPRTAEVGASFGVVLVQSGREVIEVATFRSDGDYTDKRRPDSVRYSDALHDARRRDFTVNALFLDPDAPGDLRHQVIDHVGGLADLDRRLLRAVGDAERRLAEDHLRALRAARLAARLGFTIDPATAGAIRRHAAELKGVSRERIGDEAGRMLRHATRAAAASLVEDLGLGRVIFGDAAPVPFRPRVLGHVPGHSPPGTCLAAWAIDRGFDPGTGDATALAARWRSALCLSNQDRDAMHEALGVLRLLLTAWSGAGVAQRKRTAARTGFSPALTLLGALSPGAAAGIAADVRILEGSPGGVSPPPWVTGDDLVAMGLKPGREFKRILDGVYDAQLEGKVASAAEAMELARRLSVVPM